MQALGEVALDCPLRWQGTGSEIPRRDALGDDMLLVHAVELQTKLDTPALIQGGFSLIELVAAHEKEVANLLLFIGGHRPFISAGLRQQHAKHTLAALQTQVQVE
jgi:hypothetical protein